MEKYSLIVEGKGDRNAASSLLAKVASTFGQLKCACEHPIRAGEAPKLRRQGELEKFLILASSREDASEVILLLDLDDICVIEILPEFLRRAEGIERRFKKKINICFAIKEYEGWLLDSIDSIRLGCPDHSIDPGIRIECGEVVRGAKEKLRSACRGRKYKQIGDQNLFSKKIDILSLYRKNRSFRKFVKIVTGYTYEEINDKIVALDLHV